MSFDYREGQLYAEQVPITQIAKTYGTPCYIYSRAIITQNWLAFSHALKDYPHQLCYAVKANSNLAVLNILARLGAGFDIVSEGELSRVLAAGGIPEKIVFSGVGKQSREICYALESGIGCFNVESADELGRISQIAKAMDKKAAISLRINPDVDANTHPYIATGLKENKFGIAMQQAMELYAYAAQLPAIKIIGIACHIGSQLLDIPPFLAALERLLTLITQLKGVGIELEHIDLGGGLGIRYRDEDPPAIADYIAAILTKLQHTGLRLILEPGRSIVGKAGLLITRVEYLKRNQDKHFAIVDAGMNDLLRPALYQAWQAIQPVILRKQMPRCYDIVGPVCESADYLGKDRELALQAGDLLAIADSGAYGFVMASHYNSRPRCPEVLIDGERPYLVRSRETLGELYATERMLPA